MKAITIIFLATCLVLLTSSRNVQCQSNLEERVKSVFRRQPAEGVPHSRKLDIEQLGHTVEVRQILLNIIAKYKGVTVESGGNFTELLGSIFVLGDLNEVRAIPILVEILSDDKSDNIVRSVAARAIGKIDPIGNKQHLLLILENKSNYYSIRLAAADALAKTKDASVLKLLDKYKNEEKDTFVKKQLADSAQKLRERLQDKR